MSHSRLVLPTVLLAQFVIPLSIAGSAIGLPDIADELGSRPGPLQWVVNGFNVSFAVCTLAWGALSDRVGHTRSFRAGIVIAAAGGAISHLAASMLMLDIGRVIAGVGSAAVLTGAAPILSRVYDGNAKARAFMLFGTVNGLGLAAGPSISGALVATWGWREVFLTHAVLLMVALTGTIWFPRMHRSGTSLRPLLDLSVLRNSRFLAMTIVPVAGAIGFVTFLTYTPSALRAVRDVPVELTGLFMLAMTVPVLLAPTLVHTVLATGRATTTGIVLSSFGCLTAGSLGMLTLRPDLPLGLPLVAMVLLGLGFGLPLGFVDAEALAAVPADRAGSASGVINLFRIGSEAAFVALHAVIVSSVVLTTSPKAIGEAVAAGAPGNPWDYYRGFTVAAVTMTALLLVATLVFVLLIRRANRETVRNQGPEPAEHSPLRATL